MNDKTGRIHKEGGGEKEEKGSKGDDDDGGNGDEGRDMRGRGPHPWRTPPMTTRSTSPSPPDRVILLLTPKTPPRTKMTKRGARWEYLSSGYAQWDTLRP